MPNKKKICEISKDRCKESGKLSEKIYGANVYCLWHYNMCNTGGQTIMEEHIATEKINEYM